MSDQWFSYCPEEGIEFFATEEEAKSRADALIEMWRDDARNSDGWSEEVEGVCYGKVCGQAESFPSGDEGFDFRLAPIEQAAGD